MEIKKLLLLCFGLIMAFVHSAAAAQASPPTAHTSRAYHDIYGRVTATVAPDPDGSGPLGFPATKTSYDPVGLVLKVETGELSVWQDWTTFTIFVTEHHAYDTMNRRVKSWQVGDDGQIISMVQHNTDRAGRAACMAVRMDTARFASPEANPCNQDTTGSSIPDRISRSFYDSKGQVIEMRKGIGTPLEQAEATYTYTNNGQQASVTDANGNRATYVYDGHDRLVRWNFPHKTIAGSTSTTDFEAYTYDNNGNRKTLAKRDGQIINYTYDFLNRVTKKDIPGSTTLDVYYGYDNRDLQTYARFASTAGSGLTTAYDGFGRLVSATNSLFGTPRTLTYQYDANGNRTRVTHPDGQYFSYEYDNLDRPTTIRENGGTVLTSNRYNAQSQPDLMTRIGASTSLTYDKGIRLSQMSHGLVAGDADVDFGFSYNPASQIKTRTINNDIYSATTHYDVDRGYSVNGLNQYTGTNTGATYGYDNNGNLTSYVTSEGQVNYSFDVENRLIGATGDRTANLVYDPLGRLWETNEGGSTNTTRFLYDGDALVAEYDGLGNLLQRYVHGPGVDQPVVWYDGGTVNSTSRRQLFPNWQGSVTAIADGSGNMVQVNGYDEYGIPNATNLGRFQYTGQILLPELDIYHYKARAYSPTLGRFLQTDPIGYEDQYNLYAYVGNDPIGKIDPSGTQTYFFGGAGNGDLAPYKEDFERAFEQAGIEDTRTVPESSTSPSGIIGDLATLNAVNNVTTASIYTKGVKPDGGEQYNLAGYSYGAVLAAQQALSDVKRGHTVDNLILIGAPINQDLYSAVKGSSGIRNVINVQLSGDPIFAGITDPTIAMLTPVLGYQMITGTGHFGLAGAGRAHQAKRDALARTLYGMGVR